MVLDQNFVAISNIDAYESIIWTDRYNEPGEFEIYTPVSDQMLEFPVVNNYLRVTDSEHIMIVEDITIESNVDTGNHIKIVGRSLESILDRRVVLEEVNLTGNLQNSIRSLITTNIISPSDSARRISNFIFEDSTDTKVTELTYEGQFKDKDLLEIIKEICKDKELGFKVLLNDEGQFVFSLYMGTDRSYRQDVLPYVCFKPSFENIINSNYAEKNSTAKTFCYVHAQYTDRSENNGGSSSDSESEQVDVVRTVGSGTGLLRKEVYKNASINKDDEMTLAEFYAKMDEAGNEELVDKKVEKIFDGECETTRMFVYDRDFFLGDVVQVANEYGMEAPSRVTEFIRSQSSSELKSYPTFEALDYEESEGS